MKRFFLIDYENVSDNGLDGFFDLTPEDTVYLFFTVNACKIGIEFVDQLRKQTNGASLQFIRAATGNQALDFQLSSFLGGLIATNQQDEAAFYIVSKDRGYTCLPGFWAAMRPGVRLSILPRISEESRKRLKPPAVIKPVQPQPEILPEAVESPMAEPEPTVEPTSDTPEIEGKLEPTSPAAEIAPAPAEPSIAAEPAQAAPALPKAAAPREKSVPARPKAEKSAAEAKTDGKKTLSPADRTALNSAVQQVLSKAKCEPQISGAAASLVTKMYKDGTNKQELYRGIIKSFGREKGLEVYSLIKPVLV